MTLFTSFFIALVAGLFIPLWAFNISVEATTANWPKDQPHCVTGFVIILVIGYLIDIGGCLVIAFVGRLIFVSPQNLQLANCSPAIEPIITYRKKTYLTTHGEIIIEQQYENPNTGENVFINNQPAPPGKYKIGPLSFIEVQDGKILKITFL
ncbi:MAG: hypothetical protein V4580_05055 [Bacteroidota bacterium]